MGLESNSPTLTEPASVPHSGGQILTQGNAAELANEPRLAASRRPE
jgi:hypothetical protein